MEAGRWGAHTFEVSASLIRSFTDMSIERSVETDTKKDGSAQYVAVKQYKPKTHKITVHLRSATGCDVRNEAMAFVDDIGKVDYFYVGGKKLFTCQMMLTQAQVTNIGMNGSAAWTTADVACTFTQSSKDDGGTATSQGSGSGGGNGGGKKNEVQWIMETAKASIDKGGTEKISDSTKDRLTKISSLVSTAKAATVTKQAGKTNVISTLTTALKKITKK